MPVCMHVAVVVDVDVCVCVHAMVQGLWEHVYVCCCLRVYGCVSSFWIQQPADAQANKVHAADKPRSQATFLPQQPHLVADNAVDDHDYLPFFFPFFFPDFEEADDFLLPLLLVEEPRELPALLLPPFFEPFFFFLLLPRNRNSLT